MSSHEHPFDGTEETINSTLISETELKSVLHSIEEEQFEEAVHTASPYDDWATINSICEATGHSYQEVWQIIYEHRRAQLASRISERLRELEEPLYRVERPGHHKPSSAEPILRTTQINTILDKLMPRQDHVRKKKALETTLTDRIVSTIGLIIGGMIVFGMIALIIQGILTR